MKPSYEAYFSPSCVSPYSLYFKTAVSHCDLCWGSTIRPKSSCAALLKPKSVINDIVVYVLGTSLAGLTWCVRLCRQRVVSLVIGILYMYIYISNIQTVHFSPYNSVNQPFPHSSYEPVFWSTHAATFLTIPPSWHLCFILPCCGYWVLLHCSGYTLSSFRVCEIVNNRQYLISLTHE